MGKKRKSAAELLASKGISFEGTDSREAWETTRSIPPEFWDDDDDTVLGIPRSVFEAASRAADESDRHHQEARAKRREEEAARDACHCGCELGLGDEDQAGS